LSLSTLGALVDVPWHVSLAVDDLGFREREEMKREEIESLERSAAPSLLIAPSLRS